MRFRAFRTEERGGRHQWVLDADAHIMFLLNRMFVKATPAKRFVGTFTKNPVCISDNQENCADLAWFMLKHPAHVSAKDRAHLDKSVAEFNARKERISKFAETTPAVVAPMLKPPYPYQMEAVKLLACVDRVLIADQVGLGKTVTAIAAMHLEGALPALVVCPSHLRTQWADKIDEFMAFPIHTTLTGQKATKLPDADIYITSYHLMKWWVDELLDRRIRTVIFDEVHELRAYDTEKRKACAWISEKANRCAGLSGTPIFGLGAELHSVMDVIAPGAVGTVGEFQREWCGLEGGKVVTNPKRLGEYLREQGLLIRRRAEDVGLKPDGYTVDVLSVDASLEELERISKMAVLLAQRTLTAAGLLSGQAAREFDTKLRMATGMAKAAAVAAVLNQRLQEEGVEKILCGVWHHDVRAAIQKELKRLNPSIDMFVYTGAESTKQKEEAISGFSTTKNPAVLFMNIRSGQGIDGIQQVCNHGVFAELDWSPSAHLQFVGRLARPGQTKHVMFDFVVIKDGADPPMMEVLGVKRGQRDGIVDLVDVEDVDQADESRLKVMAEQYLEKRQAMSFGSIAAKASRHGHALAAAIEALKLPMVNEAAMQDELEKYLTKWCAEQKVPLKREAVLAPDSRVDFLAGTIGVECKVKGARTDVYRQIARYAQHVSEVVLVCPWPLQDFTIDGRYVHVVYIQPDIT